MKKVGLISFIIFLFFLLSASWFLRSLFYSFAAWNEFTASLPLKLEAYKVTVMCANWVSVTALITMYPEKEKAFILLHALVFSSVIFTVPH